MSTAAAVDAVVPKKGKKKLIIMVAALAVLLAVAGGSAAMLMKKKAHAEDTEESDGGGDAEHAPAKAAKHDPKAVPTFVPLDPFTVNLADREAERYAQVGITLEVDDPHMADQIKAYMPAIRNNILLALADKTAAQMMERDGKTKLAQQLRRETAKAMGYEVDEPEAASSGEGDADKPKKKKKLKKAETALPITGVFFSNFIIQ